MSEDESAARLAQWWQGLADYQRAQFDDLKEGDPFPSEQLSPYTRASLVADTQRQTGHGVDHRVNDRLDAFLTKKRVEHG